jgi:hypothetical protein
VLQSVRRPSGGRGEVVGRLVGEVELGSGLIRIRFEGLLLLARDATSLLVLALLAQATFAVELGERRGA